MTRVITVAVNYYLRTVCVEASKHFKDRTKRQQLDLPPMMMQCPIGLYAPTTSRALIWLLFLAVRAGFAFRLPRRFCSYCYIPYSFWAAKLFLVGTERTHSAVETY